MSKMHESLHFQMIQQNSTLMVMWLLLLPADRSDRYSACICPKATQLSAEMMQTFITGLYQLMPLAPASSALSLHNQAVCQGTDCLSLQPQRTPHIKRKEILTVHRKVQLYHCGEPPLDPRNMHMCGSALTTHTACLEKACSPSLC